MKCVLKFAFDYKVRRAKLSKRIKCVFKCVGKYRVRQARG